MTDISCVARAGFRLAYSDWVIYGWQTTYNGEMLHGKMNGKGTYVTPHASQYTGYFLEDKRQGSGIYTHKDGMTTWSGNWDRDELTGRETEMKTKREDIFNKLPSGGLPLIGEGVYSGTTLNGFFHGEGTMRFATKDHSRTPIFSLEGHFIDGSLNGRDSDVHVRWLSAAPSSIRNSSLILRDWVSTWHYGRQTVSGLIIFEEEGLIFRNSNGYIERVEKTNTKMPLIVADHEKNASDAKLATATAVVEAIRALEFHFIFNRIQLAPLTSLTKPDESEGNFEGPIAKKAEVRQEL